MPELTLFDGSQDAYWAEILNQFVFPAGEIYLNGTVASSPLPVLKPVFDSYFDCERLILNRVYALTPSEGLPKST